MAKYGSLVFSSCTILLIPFACLDAINKTAPHSNASNNKICIVGEGSKQDMLNITKITTEGSEKAKRLHRFLIAFSTVFLSVSFVFRYTLAIQAWVIFLNSYFTILFAIGAIGLGRMLEDNLNIHKYEVKRIRLIASVIVSLGVMLIPAIYCYMIFEEDISMGLYASFCREIALFCSVSQCFVCSDYAKWVKRRSLAKAGKIVHPLPRKGTACEDTYDPYDSDDEQLGTSFDNNSAENSESSNEKGSP